MAAKKGPASKESASPTTKKARAKKTPGGAEAKSARHASERPPRVEAAPPAAIAEDARPLELEQAREPDEPASEPMPPPVLPVPTASFTF